MNPFALFFVAIFVLLATAVFSFEALLYRFRKEHYHDWLRAGSPTVAFETPDVSTFSRYCARWGLQRRLFLSSPDWIMRDRVAHALLLIHRLTLAIGIVSLFGFPVIALLLS